MFVTFSAIAAAALTTVSAEGWDLRSVRMTQTGAVSWEAEPIPAVITKGEDVLGLGIYCDASSYQVRFATRRGRTADFMFGTQSRTPRSVQMQLFVDDERVWRGNGLRNTTLGSVTALGTQPAAIVYNAVIRGQSVSYKVSGGRKRQVDLAPVDDAFRAFAAQCEEMRAE